ncbi:MAG TPA: SDR family NAD(P)-dependent oxidoreductase [Hyphomicrobiales bacterium]|nr:SDR family NAD(P)-dependent oxidoreductase [Hyphomicrobiales bacterium]
MTGRLDGKVAIITGTGGSMGHAAALRFAAEGAKVVGCDIHPSSGDETLAEVRQAGGTMVSMSNCDLSDIAQAKALVQLALDSFGRIDVVYNNAAMAWFGWVDEMPPETFRKTMVHEVDLVFNLCQAAWPHLIAAGGGSIVNTASKAGKCGNPNLGGIAHAAAKGAVIAMTRQLATEGGRHRIRANSISPGLVVTKQTRPLLADPGWKSKMMEQIMLDYIGEPDDIAGCAVFLASDDARFVTGADLAVDGGATAW